MSSCRSVFATNAYSVGQTSVLHYEHGEKWNGTSRLIIALHGHGGSASTFTQTVGGVSTATLELAKTGRYIILAIDAAGPTTWSNSASLADIDTAVNWARARGAKTGKYGLLGYSMGGLIAANKLKRDSANIAAVWTWAPVVDLDFVYSTAGHSPQANNATWTTEVNTAFGSYAATSGYRVWDEPASYRSLGVPWKITHATDDSVVPQSISTSFVSAVADSNVAMRTPDITGNHTGLFSNIPDAEIVAFYDGVNWS